MFTIEKKRTYRAARHAVVSARLTEADWKWIELMRAETGQSKAAIVAKCITFARESQG